MTKEGLPRVHGRPSVILLDIFEQISEAFRWLIPFGFDSRYDFWETYHQPKVWIILQVLFHLRYGHHIGDHFASFDILEIICWHQNLFACDI